MRDTRRSVETSEAMSSSVTTSAAESSRGATTGTSTGVEAGDSSTDPASGRRTTYGGGRVVMLAAPAVTVIPYPNGRYELRGDGITVPYYWAWVTAQLYIAPPPPPMVPPAAPDMPPVGSPPPPPVAG